MDCADRPVPTDPANTQDEEIVLPTAEALLAGTLALMTGFAEHRPMDGVAQAAVPRLLAAKVCSNLFCLSEYPLLSAPFRSALWRLRSHWQALERGVAPQTPVPLWLDAPPTRH